MQSFPEPRSPTSIAGLAELEAGAATREFIVHRVRRCIDAGIIDGDQVDIAHGLLALA